MIDGLSVVSKSKFQHIAAMAIHFHSDEAISIPDNPLAQARRIGLSNRTQGCLQRGYGFAQFGTSDAEAARGSQRIAHSIRRIRVKMNRVANDPEARRWRYYMGTAWCSMFVPGVRPDVVFHLLEQIDEKSYVEKMVLFIECFVTDKPNAF
jgi:hypothetical protein